MKQRNFETLHTLAKSGWILSVMILAAAAAAAATSRATEHAGAVMPRLPLSFVANAGQLDPAVEFSARQGRHTLLVGAAETALVSAPAGGEAAPTIVRMRFVGADPAVEVEGRDRLPGVAHFYRGNDSERWITGVATYGATAQVDLYPGITQVYRASASLLKSEFLVAPGADPAQIRMEYSGIEALSITAGGELVVRSAGGEWRESAPVVYQEIGGRRLEVPASFRLLAAGQVGFTVGSHDPAHELVIDPALGFSTYLGGNAGDEGVGIAVDSGGNVIVAGLTTSTDFPLAFPVQAAKAGPVNNTQSANDFFVAKLDPSGSVLLYSTYLGGSARELLGDVAVDPVGNAYVAGWTASSDFPTTAGVWGPGPFGVGGSRDDAAVVKLDPTGALVYSTYLGGSSDDQPEDIAVDAAGHAYVMGNSGSANFPTTPGAYQETLAGVWDVFVTKLEPDASGLVYSTFIGDSGYDEPLALALDAAGNTYVTGRTQSPNFPVTAGAYDTVYNGTDTVFLTKLNASGSSLVYSTFLDGIARRFVARQLDVAVDSNANAYVVAPSEGSGFPATPGAWDETFNGGTDVVVMKLDASGSTCLYSTYLGGFGVDEAYGLAVDVDGSAVLAGFTGSADFPLSDPLPGQGSFGGGGRDGFVARLSAGGDALVFASFLGGTASESARAIALGASGICVVGATASTDFPVAGAAPFQSTFAGGGSDAFVLCLGGESNLPPDCSEAVPSAIEFWPPNHRFHQISVLGVTDPDGDAVTVTIDSIFQDEPVDTIGDGNTCPDGDGTGTSTAQVRAERAGSKKVPGDGRVYHIGFAAADGKGGTCEGTVTVCVPHDQRPGGECVDGGPLFDSTVCPE